MTVPLLLLAAASCLFAQSGARYLIIAHDNFFDAVQPLAEWKHKKGMPDTVIKMSQIGSSNNQIRSFIVNAWNTWNPRPEFLLLVGSGYYIPSFGRGRGMDAMFTDNPFANAAGDYRAELPYGRLPCKTTRQCSVMVAKILAYERTPDLDDTLWFRRGTTIVADSGDSDGWLYWQDARYYAALAAAAGYADIDSLSSSHHDDAQDVIQSVNTGTSFVLFRGTAGANWWIPFNVNPGQTDNGARLPIICSFTCQTEALNRYDSMVGDAWMRVGAPESPRGAVAFLGNTHSAMVVAPIRSAVTHAFFDRVFSDSAPYLGCAALSGKEKIFTQFHDSLEYMGFNLLGDPELNLWTTTPQPLQVAHDSTIPGPGDFTVSVRKVGLPLHNALVCIWDHSTVYEYGCTDSSGRITFYVDPHDPGILDVTVTARNCIPYEGTARILSGGITEKGSRIQEFEGSSTELTVTPNPGSGLFTISCDRASLIEIRDVTGRTVARFRIPNPRSPAPSPLLSAPSPLLWDARALPAGVYLLRATCSDGAQENRLVRILR
jgi:hypothetical protein